MDGTTSLSLSKLKPKGQRTLPSHRVLLNILDVPYHRDLLQVRLDALAHEILERSPATGVYIYFPAAQGEPLSAIIGDLNPHLPPQQAEAFRQTTDVETTLEPKAVVLSRSEQEQLQTRATYGMYIPFVETPAPGFLFLVFNDVDAMSEEIMDILLLYAHILAHVFADVQVLDDLRTLLKAARDLVESEDLQVVLQRLLHHAMNITATEAASILLQDQRTGKLVFKAATGPHPERLLSITVPLNSIAGRALREQRAIIIRDVSKSSEHFRLVDETTGFHTRSLIAVPIRWRERSIGVLEVLNKRDGCFTDHDLEMLQALAGQAAAIIMQAQLSEERKRALQELRELDERKTQFMHLASHELRTPLTIIRGYAEMAEEIMSQTGTPDEQTWETLKMLVTEILGGAKRMSAVVDEITRAAGTSPHPSLHSMSPLDLRDVVTWVLKELESWAESKQLHLDVNLPDHSVIILGDKARLQDALLHVVGNAVKFTPEHGRVEVAMWIEEERVFLSISDTGPGIPPEEQERIFDPFYQVESPLTRQHPGMGLGLTIAKDVIEQHAGHIWVESALGQGSTFTIVLPLEPLNTTGPQGVP